MKSFYTLIVVTLISITALKLQAKTHEGDEGESCNICECNGGNRYCMKDISTGTIFFMP